MSKGLSPLGTRLLAALVREATWVSREALQAAVADRSPVAVEAELAELVMAGHVQYRANVGYRLPTVQEARLAAQMALEEGVEVAGIYRKHDEGWRLGVAQDCGAHGMATYFEDLPPGAGLDGVRARMQALGVRDSHARALADWRARRRAQPPVLNLRGRALRAIREAAHPPGPAEVAQALGLCVWEVTPALHSAREAGLASCGRDGCWRVTERFDQQEIHP